MASGELMKRFSRVEDVPIVRNATIPRDHPDEAIIRMAYQRAGGGLGVDYGEAFPGATRSFGEFTFQTKRVPVTTFRDSQVIVWEVDGEDLAKEFEEYVLHKLRQADIVPKRSELTIKAGFRHCEGEAVSIEFEVSVPVDAVKS